MDTFNSETQQDDFGSDEIEIN
jgi:hypothetical protein